MHRRKERRGTGHRKRESERERRGGGSGDKRAAGNKRLANPSCQFNLASNPGEMLIRASLPFLPPLPPSLEVSLSAPFRSFRISFPFRGLLRVAHARTRARAGHDTLFSRKDTAAAATTWKLCAKRAAPAVFLPFIRRLSSARRPTKPSLSAFHPRNLSRLCRARGGICTNG